MLHSMTGFARESFHLKEGQVIWEIKSVNHRHLDVSTRLPENLRDLEMLLRDRVKNQVARGKVDIHLTLKEEGVLNAWQVNVPLVKQITQAAAQVGALTGNTTPLSTAEMLRWPGILFSEEQNIDAFKEQVLQAFDKTLKAFNTAREREGAKMAAILQERLQQIALQVQSVQPLLTEIQAQHRARLLQRFTDLQVTLDPSRLEQEMLLLLQKMDVAEELDRLTVHRQEFEHLLKTGGVIGRQLDFLLQEFNREANTLGSKSIATSTTKVSVELKVLIEQMREQVQNIE